MFQTRNQSAACPKACTCVTGNFLTLYQTRYMNRHCLASGLDCCASEVRFGFFYPKRSLPAHPSFEMHYVYKKKKRTHEMIPDCISYPTGRKNPTKHWPQHVEEKYAQFVCHDSNCQVLVICIGQNLYFRRQSSFVRQQSNPSKTNYWPFLTISVFIAV